ncbi:conserved Plasmodium protein, unknown function [Plasmodium ovale wallikeri]|uniref:Uncharacterized protein n=1 Tax=Plasmodium ovale wallikeri TaxID=864142 RepID=A0A1A9ACE4_PLAOA|nr:conserved Plasmodium protein, unknown function [Plasmodium ovale wallikeri]SBT57855.1 conserved Plasmodium protein, unknown function [Plasmodium ovale wallikeri]
MHLSRCRHNNFPRIQREFIRRFISSNNTDVSYDSIIYHSYEEKLKMFMEKYGKAKPIKMGDLSRYTVRKKTLGERFVKFIKKLDNQVNKFLMRKMVYGFSDPRKKPKGCFGKFIQFLNDNKYFVLLAIFVIGAIPLARIAVCGTACSLLSILFISVPLLIALHLLRKVLRINYYYYGDDD